MSSSWRMTAIIVIPIVLAIGALTYLNVRSRPEILEVKFGSDGDGSGRQPQIPENAQLTTPPLLDGPALKSQPVIDSEAPAGFADLVFHTLASKFDLPRKDGKERLKGYGFAARGWWQRKKVGFEILLLEPWEKWTPQGMKYPLYRGAALIHSVGPLSDEFLRALATLYGVRPIPQKFAEYCPVEVISLEGQPNRPDLGVLKLKLFFGEKEGDPTYGELFLGIDVKKERLTLVEKDTAYRQAIVRALAARR